MKCRKPFKTEIRCLRSHCQTTSFPYCWPPFSFQRSNLFQHGNLKPAKKNNRPNNNYLFKKSTSHWPPAQSTRTKMTANGFSSYELSVKLGLFNFTLRLKVMLFCQKVLFHFQALRNCSKGILCSDLRNTRLFSSQGLSHFFCNCRKRGASRGAASGGSDF